MTSRSQILAAGLLAGMVWLAVPAAAQQPQPQKPEVAEPKKLAAVINGEVLTAEDLDRLWNRLSPEMRASYEQAGGKLTFLDNYIRKRLLIQEAIKQGFDRKPEVAFDLEQVRESALFDRYIRDVVAEEVISESDLVAYYETHQEEFRQPEMIRARHIIAMPGQQAVENASGSDALTDEEALEKIKGLAMHFRTLGGNFADAAMQFSEDGTARLGGDLGWFPRGKMAPEFEVAAFELKIGETSSVVKTQFGYHVIYLQDRRPAGIAPFAEVRAQIRENFLRDKQAQVIAAVNDLTQQLRGASRISVYRENL
jgi:peptidyl-prolyl cis-trans isomerase C